MVTTFLAGRGNGSLLRTEAGKIHLTKTINYIALDNLNSFFFFFTSIKRKKPPGCALGREKQSCVGRQIGAGLAAPGMCRDAARRPAQPGFCASPAEHKAGAAVFVGLALSGAERCPGVCGRVCALGTASPGLGSSSRLQRLQSASPGQCGSGGLAEERGSLRVCADPAPPAAAAVLEPAARHRERTAG